MRAPRLVRMVFVSLMAGLATSCGRGEGDTAQKSETSAIAASGEATQTDAASEFVMGVPAVGRVEDEVVTVTGRGTAPALALNDALRKAVTQVNGADVAGATTQEPNMGFEAVFSEKRTGSIPVVGGTTDQTLSARLSSYHDDVVSGFAGQVSRFEILSENKMDIGYEVQAKVTVPKFAAPSSKRLKVVVAVPRAAVSAFRLDGREIPAVQVAESIRSRVSQALMDTGRVDILDRSFDAEVDAELERMASGKTTREAKLRLSQQMAADFVWVAAIEQFEIKRSVQTLRIGGGRKLESLSGGAAMSHRLVNVATGQVIFSGSVSAGGPENEPTTLGIGVNVEASGAKMTEQLGAKSARELVSRLFPVVVLSRSGNTLVLSQGKAAVREGLVYQLVVLGDSLVDPQTGESLGYMEQDGGAVSVNRVSDRVAYGVATNPTALPSVIKPGQVQIREEISVGGTGLREGRTGGASTAGSSTVRRMPAQADDPSDVDVDFDFQDTPKRKKQK